MVERLFEKLENTVWLTVWFLEEQINNELMNSLKLCLLESRRARADQQFLFNLLHGREDASWLLKRISLLHNR